MVAGRQVKPRAAQRGAKATPQRGAKAKPSAKATAQAEARPEPKTERPAPRRAAGRSGQAPVITFALTVDGAVRAHAPWRARLGRAVTRMLRAAALREGAPALEASLRLTDDATIHQLNRDFRRKDKPTDVLAFAQREGPWAGVGAELLGDIVISLPTARRQAKRKGAEGLYLEVRFLAAHGLCHLLGYDHRNDREEQEMNLRMATLLVEAGRTGAVRPA